MINPLDILVSPAIAEGAAGQSQQGGLLSFLPLILLFVVFYFLLIRPQRKKSKEHKQMVNELKIGDEVVTQGGFLGKIKSMDDVFLKMEIDASTIVTVQRNSVAALMPQGTYKSSDKEKESQPKKKRESKPRSQVEKSTEDKDEE